MAGTWDRIRHELTRERHRPFLDGLLDPTATMIYTFLGKEQKADHRLISSPYRPYNPRQEGSDPSTTEACLYAIGHSISSIPSTLLLVINYGLKVKYGRDSLAAEDEKMFYESRNSLLPRITNK